MWGRAEVAQAWGRLLRVRDMNLSLLLDSQENWPDTLKSWTCAPSGLEGPAEEVWDTVDPTHSDGGGLRLGGPLTLLVMAFWSEDSILLWKSWISHLDWHVGTGVRLSRYFPGCAQKAASSGKPSSLFRTGITALIPGLRICTPPSDPSPVFSDWSWDYFCHRCTAGTLPHLSLIPHHSLSLCPPAPQLCHVLLCPLLPPTTGPLHMLFTLLKTPTVPNLISSYFFSSQFKCHFIKELGNLQTRSEPSVLCVHHTCTSFSYF